MDGVTVLRGERDRLSGNGRFVDCRNLADINHRFPTELRESEVGKETLFEDRGQAIDSLESDSLP